MTHNEGSSQKNYKRNRYHRTETATITLTFKQLPLSTLNSAHTCTSQYMWPITRSRSVHNRTSLHMKTQFPSMRASLSKQTQWSGNNKKWQADKEYAVLWKMYTERNLVKTGTKVHLLPQSVTYAMLHETQLNTYTKAIGDMVLHSSNIELTPGDTKLNICSLHCNTELPVIRDLNPQIQS